MTRPHPLHAAATALICGLLFASCAGDDESEDRGRAEIESASASSAERASGSSSDVTTTVGGGSRPVLDAGATWQWQIEGELNSEYDVDIYDVDMVDTEASAIENLHRDGRIVICYFSAGTYEEWRGDASRYPADAIGEPLDDWPDERWVDIGDPTVRQIQLDRLDEAAAKGCDGVEPDNVAGFDDDNGFGFSEEDQLDFNRFLADAAHQRGLLIGLKNALSQIPELVDHYDFAVNEECHEYEECDVYEPFLAAGKPVLNAEYAERFVDDPDTLCAEAAGAGTRTLILPLDLDDTFRIACP